MGKRVLVTGYEGFLGSHLTKKLLKLGYEFVGFDKQTYRRDTILEKSDYQKIKVINGSILNLKLIKNVLSRYQPDIVLHLAAEATVTECLKNPIKGFTVNIEGSWKLLEACRQNPKIHSIIIASSDKAYGPQTKLPYHETDSLAGTAPYDVSKSCEDLLAQSYLKTFHLPVVIIRCGNIYGPGDFHFSRLIPETIKAIFENKPIVLRSNGRFSRDFVYIEDVVNAYVGLMEKNFSNKLTGQAFNIGSGKPTQVLEVVEKIYRISGKLPNYRIDNLAGGEIKDQYLSVLKARKILGWKAKITLDEGLTKTVKWYQNYFLKRIGLKNS